MGRRTMTEKAILQMQKEGHGQGEGAQYLPWIEVTSLSSDGNSTRAWSHKTGRLHHLLSDIELSLFFSLDWASEVVDIREQYPLDREFTKAIAEELGIAHPIYPTKEKLVITVDFMVTVVRDGIRQWIALNAKPSDKRLTERTLEKLEIQRTYFERLKIPHHLIFDKHIPSQLVANCRWLTGSMLSSSEKHLEQEYEEISQYLLYELATASPIELMHQFCASVDKRHALKPGLALRVAKILIHTRKLLAPMNKAPLRDLAISEFWQPKDQNVSLGVSV